LERLALVPAPGPEWASVVAALLDGRSVYRPLDAHNVRYCATLGAWSTHVVRDRESVTAFKFLRGLTDDNATTVGRQQDRK